MRSRHDHIVSQLCEAGFLVTYHSTAVTLLYHPGYPGLEARIGTVSVALERDGREIYRASLDTFDLSEAVSSLKGSQRLVSRDA